MDGDEENSILINLLIETPESFAFFKADTKKLSVSGVVTTTFSDDVMSCFNESEQQLSCYIAIPQTEQELLEHQPKLLAGFMQAKLRKVLNLIAAQQSLASI